MENKKWFRLIVCCIKRKTMLFSEILGCPIQDPIQNIILSLIKKSNRFSKNVEFIYCSKSKEESGASANMTIFAVSPGPGFLKARTIDRFAISL